MKLISWLKEKFRKSEPKSEVEPYKFTEEEKLEFSRMVFDQAEAENDDDDLSMFEEQEDDEPFPEEEEEEDKIECSECEYMNSPDDEECEHCGHYFGHYD